MMRTYPPTRAAVAADRDDRHRIRSETRAMCMKSGNPHWIKAAEMAMNGYGVDNIVAGATVTRDMASRLVLGRGSER